MSRNVVMVISPPIATVSDASPRRENGGVAAVFRC
jgi:hypothetical protein